MRLLGASAPNTDEGTIVGKVTAAPAAKAELFKKFRRLSVNVLLLVLLFIVSSFLLSEDI